MKLHTSSRRTFLQKSLTVSAAAVLLKPAAFFCSSARGAQRRCQSLRLGGPSFAKTDDPEALALAHRKLGYRAAYCPDIPLNAPDKIRAYADAFARRDVVIAEVGRWVNLLDADAEKRRANLQKVIEGLELADAIGALCCVDIAGSYNPTVWYGPQRENLSKQHFDASVENARKIVDAVKPKRAKFCYEMMGWLWPDTPAHYVKMLKAVDRKAFAIHLDPCNIVNSPEKFYDNAGVLNDCFDKLGRWIASCHAKDLTWDVEMNIHFREVAPGKGSVDYDTYLRRLSQLPQNPPLMLEHLSTAEEYTGAREHIFEVGRKAGLSF